MKIFDTLITAAQLQDILSPLETLVVDCRFSLADTGAGRRAYLESHIDGALYAHLDDDLSAAVIPGKTGRHPLPAIEKMEKCFSNWGIDNRIQVVAYDDNGGAIAARLWWMLQYAGHSTAAVLDGGWSAWREAGGAVSATVRTPPRTAFKAQVRPEMVAGVDAVLAAARGEAALIDARAAERFQGIVEPLDAIAGHIPGAQNLPWGENLDDGGHMKDPAAIGRQFAAITGRQTAAPVVYCGSGVTACHHLLAMAWAGLPPGRLYPGSWSEWITDAQRPMATGAASNERDN